MSQNVYEKHIARSLNVAELVIPNTFHCVTPNCAGWCEKNEASRFFACPVCDRVNCLKCKVSRPLDGAFVYYTDSYFCFSHTPHTCIIYIYIYIWIYMYICIYLILLGSTRELDVRSIQEELSGRRWEQEAAAEERACRRSTSSSTTYAALLYTVNHSLVYH